MEALNAGLGSLNMVKGRSRVREREEQNVVMGSVKQKRKLCGAGVIGHGVREEQTMVVGQGRI